ncbi:uncharacterized protein BKA78DRAFT_298068 [Phyllosticta capitalensis]|uniref:uncharacterized protein n=1 Tax=Phyllosticta capitalensis TaxID=121624 RepID=UPI0031301EAC
MATGTLLRHTLSTTSAEVTSTLTSIALGLPRTRSSTQLGSLTTGLPTPTSAAAAATSLATDSGIDFELPSPPLFLTVSAFILTCVAVVLAVGVWMISWPPDCGDEQVEEFGQEQHDVEEEEESEWSSNEEYEETTWMMGKAFEDAVELKRLLSNTTSPPSPPLSGERHGEQRNNKRNTQGLRLDLSAAAGLGVGPWGRAEAGRCDCCSGQTANHHNHAVKNDSCKHHKHDENESVLSLSFGSDADTEAGLVDSSDSAGAAATASSTTLSSTTKPIFNQPLHGWRKTVDDRVGVLASWIERYVADGGRERDLLCKIRKDERGDVVCGFEF